MGWKSRRGSGLSRPAPERSHTLMDCDRYLPQPTTLRAWLGLVLGACGGNCFGVERQREAFGHESDRGKDRRV